jgi:hypothetical protein
MDQAEESPQVRNDECLKKDREQQEKMLGQGLSLTG